MAELYELNCPHCERVYRLSRDRIEQNAGREIRCRQCNEVFVLPAIETAEDAEPAVPLSTLGEAPPAEVAPLPGGPGPSSQQPQAADGPGTSAELASPATAAAFVEPMSAQFVSAVEPEPPEPEAPEPEAPSRPTGWPRPRVIVQDVQQHRFDGIPRRGGPSDPEPATAAGDAVPADPPPTDAFAGPFDPPAPETPAEAADDPPLDPGVPATASGGDADRGIADAFAATPARIPPPPEPRLPSDEARQQTSPGRSDEPAAEARPRDTADTAGTDPGTRPDRPARGVAPVYPPPPASTPTLPAQTMRQIASIRRWLVTLVVVVVLLVLVESAAVYLAWTAR